MKRTIYRLLLLIILICSGCAVTDQAGDDDEDVESTVMSAHEVLNRVRKVIDPENKLDSIKMMDAEISEFITGRHERNRYETQYIYKYCSDPLIYNLTIKEKVLSAEREEIKESNIIINGSDIKIHVNGVEIAVKELDDAFVNRLVFDARDFKSKLTLGLFDKYLSLKGESRTFRIKDRECYKLMMVLRTPFIDGSGHLDLFVDCDSFKIVKIETEYFTISEIHYGKFGDFNLIDRLKVDDHFGKDGEQYFIIDKLELNGDVLRHSAANKKSVKKENKKPGL